MEKCETLDLNFRVVDEIFTADYEDSEVVGSSVVAVVSDEAALKEKFKDDLQMCAKHISSYCANTLAHIDSMDIKEIKEVSKVVIDLYKAMFPVSEVTINNNVNNISNTQLNFFKQGLINEI